MFKGSHIGRWWWKKTWFSVCSRHYIDQPDCHMCQCGQYSNDLLLSVSHYFHNHHYILWRWWVDRRPDKWLEATFPRLKNTDNETPSISKGQHEQPKTHCVDTRPTSPGEGRK
jgi:hypothetical protein